VFWQGELVNYRYRYPLSLQTVLPDDYSRNKDFGSLLELLRELGFWGVELNLGDSKDHDFEAVQRFLGQFGLEFSMLATGLTARRLGLSLSDSNEVARSRAVEKCREMIAWVRNPQTGVILGLIKGGPSPEPEIARRQFALSLAELVPTAKARKVAILVEATNRYETAVANTVADAVGLIGKHGVECAQVLPDTFHMNIEEADLPGALRANRDCFRSLHLSDNNRYYPGFGAIDFGRIVACLAEIGYQGRLAIEGNTRVDLRSDLRATMKHLAPLLEG
jgi:sugar phosphate isomerase/epimerase